jgi:hypothetical protein
MCHPRLPAWPLPPGHVQAGGRAATQDQRQHCSGHTEAERMREDDRRDHREDQQRDNVPADAAHLGASA